MPETVTIDLRHVARGLGIPLRQVEAVVELLDDGNTVPFITRYRKDQTGGLDEEQIRQVQARLAKNRLLAERKQTILRSIESQGKLTEELAQQILAAGSTRRLEDLYLPFKPKKQTLATTARTRGLEPLAEEILRADPACANLDQRAADFVNPDKQVPTAADALLGAGHILAEVFSERPPLRHKIREILARSGKLVSSKVGAASKPAESPAPAVPVPKEPAAPPPSAPPADAPAAPRVGEPTDEKDPSSPCAEQPPSEAESAPGQPDAVAEPRDEAAPALEPSDAGMVQSGSEALAPAEAPLPDPPEAEETANPGGDRGSGEGGGELPSQPDSEQAHTETEPASADSGTGQPEKDPGSDAADQDQPVLAEPEARTPSSGETVPGPSADTSPETETGQTAGVEPSESSAAAEAPGVAVQPAGSEPVAAAEPGPPPAPAAGEDARTAEPAESRPPPGASAAVPEAPARASGAKTSDKPARPKRKPTKAELRRQKKEQKKKRVEQRKEKAFSDYFDFQEELKKIPPHRVLAINRGERAKVLRVRIESDHEAMHRVLDEECVAEDRPHAEFLRGCARDALARLILPALERELRREMTEKAEAHAVEVFAKNLRNLLLQPPVRGRRVLAVDPGFKSGCKLAALDQFGNVLAHDVIYLVGRPERREEANGRVAALVDRFGLSVVAIGNGTACREAEDFFSEMIAGELKDRGVRYVIVNEAGASVYSTNRLGREEFPEYDASARGAISIGRRLQDPLSELVKIDPANIGVGLYQHDVKAKHLQASLDEVVESCVNYVGVDVNTASPSLLGHVSGLNQLTARRVFDHRMDHGPFRSRAQLKDVQGLGDATFVQAAGFLKISAGENPLDATWIHPESYEIAIKLLEKLDCPPENLLRKEAAADLPERIAALDLKALAGELGVGELTLKDILAQFVRPGRDPREDLPPPIFKQGVLKLEDLEPGMELSGTVLNVVDFGAFVDIGMHDSGLVHVSQLADRFVRDPHEVIAVGQIVKVWVVKVDKERRRVSLTMIPPGSKEKQRPPRRSEGKPQDRDPPPRSRRPEGRPPGKGRGGPPRGKGGRPAPKPQYKPKPRPKPVKPLTEGMKKGDEPMRTFGDLLQFYQLKQGDPEEKASKPDDAPKNTEPPEKPQPDVGQDPS